jgi:hypothetical protein
VRVTIRQMLLLVLLIAFNLAAALVSFGHYPHRRLGYGSHSGTSGLSGRKYCQDGSIVYFQIRPPAFLNGTAPLGILPAHDWHMISPPMPSLLRIVSPVIASITVSLLVIVIAIRGWPTIRNSRGRTSLYLAAGLTIFLVSPAVLIMCDPQSDYHSHELTSAPDGLRSVPDGLCYHASPFWERYRRLLLWQPWPGDFVCPIPPETPYPPDFSR